MGVCCEKFIQVEKHNEKPENQSSSKPLLSVQNSSQIYESSKKLKILKSISKGQSVLTVQSTLKSTCIGTTINIDNNINRKTEKEPTIIEDKNLIHISIYGSPKTGKTTFANRLSKRKTNSLYVPSKCTEIIKPSMRFDDLDKEKYTFFITIPPSEQPQIIKANCYYVFFDLSNPQTFIEAQNFIVTQLVKFGEPIFLIGNMSDQKSQVSKEKIARFCKSQKCFYFEISALQETGLINLMSFTKDTVLGK